jgi:hypothetical protein
MLKGCFEKALRFRRLCGKFDDVLGWGNERSERQSFVFILSERPKEMHYSGEPIMLAATLFLTMGRGISECHHSLVMEDTGGSWCGEVVVGISDYGVFVGLTA